MNQIPQAWIDNKGQRAEGIILHEYRAVYIPIPKVACTSIKTFFADMLGLDGDIHFEPDFPKIQNELLREKYPDYYVFSFVQENAVYLNY